MRTSNISRKTNETDIEIVLNIDGSGIYDIDTGCGFLNHMLELFSHHGRFDLTVKCVGDIEVDFHHTTEDVAIVLGEAFKEALGDKKGIVRYGDITLPMDESLILAAVDLCGRQALGYKLDIPSPKVGDFDTELVREFMLGFSRSLACALHLVQFSGEDSHHIIEGAFKALARALKQAVSIDSARQDEIPSTKGII